MDQCRTGTTNLYVRVKQYAAGKDIYALLNIFEISKLDGSFFIELNVLMNEDNTISRSISLILYIERVRMMNGRRRFVFKNFYFLRRVFLLLLEEFCLGLFLVCLKYAVVIRH